VLSRAVTPKRRGRRPLTTLAIVAVVVGLLAFAGTALAVHDEAFQLDGDTDATTTTNKGSPPHIQTIDWDSLFTAAGAAKDPLPAGFSDASFVKDFNNNGNTFLTNDSSTFATGSKDTLPITPGWQCNRDNNVNSKIDVMNAYTAAYEDPTSGDQFLYFALERNTNTGTADVGFWFFQDEVGCTSPGGAVPFTGDHLDGDVLIVSEFSNGGTVSTINVYRWDRNNGDPDCTADPEPDPSDCVRNQAGVPGSLNPTPVGGGVDCRSGTTTPGDNACASANTTANGTGGTITVPWLTANFKDKVGHKLRTSEFFEGGINLTDLGFGDKCFSSFLGDTRSSTSLTATLFDYAGGTVGECNTTLETDAGDTDNGGIASPTSIGDGSVSSGTDTATITVSGANTWSGDLTFFLCGPDANLTSCDMDLGYEVSTTTIDETSTGSDLVSGDVQITSAGTYCWTAHFEPDADTAAAGVGPGDDDGTNECFTVAPVTPTLSTAAGLDVVLGSPLEDSATLSGAATEPGTNGTNDNYKSIGATDLAYAGTITFTLKGPSDTGCGDDATGTGDNPQTVNVDTTTGNGVYGPVSFTPDAVGNFHWQATYTNTDSANNTSPVTHNANCDEAAEDVTVTGAAAFTTAQNWLPNDSATLTAPTGTTLNGTLTFTLFDTEDCTGNDLYTESFTITGGDPTGESRTTTNGSDAATTFLAEASDHFSWLVTYDDDALDDPSDSCKEDSNLEIDNVTDPS